MEDNYEIYLHYDLEIENENLSIDYGISEKEFWNGILNAYGKSELKDNKLLFLKSAIAEIYKEADINNVLKEQLKTKKVWYVLKNYFYSENMTKYDILELDEQNGSLLKDYYEQDAYNEYNTLNDCSDRIEFCEV